MIKQLEITAGLAFEFILTTTFLKSFLISVNLKLLL